MTDCNGIWRLHLLFLNLCLPVNHSGLQAAGNVFLRYCKLGSGIVTRHGMDVVIWMSTFRGKLLMVEQAIGEQGVVSCHRHLHRLDDALKVLDTMQYLLYGCYARVVRRLLPLALGMHKLVTQ